MLEVTYSELDFFRSDWWGRGKGLYKTLLQMTDVLLRLFIEFSTPIFCGFSSFTLLQYIIIRVKTTSKNVEHTTVICTVILTYQFK